jgi:hypothetical protein
MEPWQREGREFVFDPKNPPVVNNHTSRFFQAPLRSSLTVVVAPKGYGKTLLLRFRAHSLRSASDAGVTFFPTGDSDIEYLDVRLDPDEMWTLLPKIHGADEWSSLWEVALLAVGCCTADPDMRFEPRLESVFAPTRHVSVSAFFGNVIRAVKQRNFLCGEGVMLLRRQFAQTGRDVVLFIDNADEALRWGFNASGVWWGPSTAASSGAPEVADTAERTGNYSYDIAPDRQDIWADLQIGLLLAVRSIDQHARRLHVYTSLRSEAVNGVRHPLQQQALGSCVRLAYSPDDLEQIFYQNIALEPAENLVNPDSEHPMDRFIGMRVIPHSYVREPAGRAVQEDAFQFLLRHSLFSPRDLMEFGIRISSLSREVRAGPNALDEIKRTVNNDACPVVFETWKLNAIPRFSQHYMAGFEMLTTNAPLAEEVARIDRAVAELASRDRYPPLSWSYYLHQHGLLGQAKARPGESGVYTQSFLASWEQRVGGHVRRVTASHVYFVHPVLTQTIREIATGFRPDEKNIIGNSRLFTQNVPQYVIRARDGDARAPILFRCGKRLWEDPEFTSSKGALLVLLYALHEYSRTHIPLSILQDVTSRFMDRFQLGRHTIRSTLRDSHLNSQLGAILGRRTEYVTRDRDCLVVNICDPQDIHIDGGASLAAGKDHTSGRTNRA